MAAPNSATTSTARAGRQLRRRQTLPPPSPPNPAIARADRLLRRRQTLATPPPPSPPNPATAVAAPSAVTRKRRRRSPPPPPSPPPAPSPASAVAASNPAIPANLASENRRKLWAAMAAVGTNPGAEIVARGAEILANALVAPKTYTQFLAARVAIAHPEYHRMFAAAVAYMADNPGTGIPDDSLGGVKLAEVTACITQAATTTFKVEGYYLHFAKKLFQLLEDAKRLFGVDKDEITERLQKEKAAPNPAPNPATTATAAPNPDSVSQRKLAVAAAVAAATTATAATAAQAASVDNPQLKSPSNLAAVATAAQAAFVDKIKCYYLELAKKLFEPLEDAKRAFAKEKDEITERLQKEKDEITERLQKEKDEITERLQKEKDEITERLQKEKDAITERLQKEKDAIADHRAASEGEGCDH